MFALALSLDQGFGCRMDPVRAAQLLTSLCDKYHYPPAAMILATYYLNGRGVEKALCLPMPLL
jgi:TPR repeat protein